MKILYVVQRYGERIIGGSEAACRAFAEQLTMRGHEVEVLTSCAHNYTDWSDEYEPGIETIGGVKVHRLPVTQERRPETFGPIHDYLMKAPDSLPQFEQQRWARLMGPDLVGQRSWLAVNSTRFDVVVFMTYLYATTTLGLPVVAGRVPTVLQPTAHDEPPAYVPLYQSLFRLPDSFLFFTEEERQVVQNIYGLSPVGEVVGIGIPQEVPPGRPQVARKRLSMGDMPYLVYVGRLDASKGVGELIRYFAAFRERTGRELRLVLLGGGDLEIPRNDFVTNVGFVDEETKRDLIAGAFALVQPSYFESFSIVLCEAWVQARPALVQGKCAVLRGQAMRSAGAIPYEGYAEFEASLEFLLDHPEIANSMGRSGQQYVAHRYQWDAVLEATERVLAGAIEGFSQRRLRTMPGR
jgi:glycosyltransferase involved in cell wall biosynthesis